MINRVVLIGRLTKDVELRYTPSGVAVATFTLAVNRPFSNGQGERQADYISIVAWRQLAELAANYLKKGSAAGLEGRLQTRSYDNKEGKRVYITEVVADNIQFLSPTGQNQGSSNQSGQGQSSGNSRHGGGNTPDDPFAYDSRTIDIQDDDLPF